MVAYNNSTTQFRKFDTSRMPAQRRMMQSAVHELLLSGAFGGGKSLPGCEKGLFLSLRYPWNKGVIARKTFASLKNTTLATWLEDVCLPEHKQSYNQADQVYKLINGSEVLFMGLDDPQKAGSLNLGWTFLDEASEFDEEDYKMFLGRLRLNRVPIRQMIAATNPANTDHWLYDRFYNNGGTLYHYDEDLANEYLNDNKGTIIYASDDRAVGVREAWVVERIGDADREVVESNSLQNPYLPSDYLAILNTYTGVYYDRFVKGLWIGFEGLVYEEYDNRKHLIEPFTIPADWVRYISIDFGYTNPFVCQWWAVHPKRERLQPTPETCICDGGRNVFTGKMMDRNIHSIECLNSQPINCACPAPVHEESYYLYREIYMSQRRVEQHASTMQRFHEPVKARFTDHDAGDRAVLERCGFPTALANKEIETGVQTVKSLLAANRLFFFRNSLVEKDTTITKGPKSTTEEFGSYHWEKATTGKNDKEHPADKDNHGMDAMRYFLHTLLFQSGGNRIATAKKPPDSVHTGTRDWGSYLNKGRGWRSV